MSKRAETPSEALIKRVSALISRRGLADSQTPVLLMVSGGSDSTALAYLCAELRDRGALGPMAALHVNHKLRGLDSDADALFVDTLADHLGIPLFNCELNPGALQAQGVNLEAEARSMRYSAASDALDSLCAHFGADPKSGIVFTAHTADDRVENFFMRSIVGTGPGGFRSMDHSVMLNGTRVCRPLLEESRESLRQYVMNHPAALSALRFGSIAPDGEDPRWREDRTNAETDRFRTFVRHEMVAKAKERNPQLLETLTRTMNLIADEDDMLNAQSRELLISLVKPLGYSASEGFLVSPELAAEAQPMQRRVFDRLLGMMLGADARVETASIQACMDALGVSGAVNNIQGDLAISYNNEGLRIEPMLAFRARRNRL